MGSLDLLIQATLCIKHIVNQLIKHNHTQLSNMNKTFLGNQNEMVEGKTTLQEQIHFQRTFLCNMEAIRPPQTPKSKSELKKRPWVVSKQKRPSFTPKLGDLDFLTTEKHKKQIMGME